MCDETNLDEFTSKGLSLREFAATGALAGLSACTSIENSGSTSGLTERMVQVPTADGTMDAFFVHPAKKAPAVILFFFFQAEDGIRDLYVTGVQTCALPI